MLIKLLVIKVDQKIEGPHVVLLRLLILVTLWADAVFCVSPFLMYIIARHHNYFKPLIVGVIFFAENKQILILPINAVQTSFLPSLYFLECWLGL